MKVKKIYIIILIVFIMVSLLRKRIKRGFRYVSAGKVTEHFRWVEFDCKDGTSVPDELKGNVTELAKNLEVIREASGGKPITIVSGFRTHKHNQKIGGVKNSQHLLGKAADIIVKGMTSQEVSVLILNLIRENKIKRGGVGLYPGFVHYDIRGFNRYWVG